MKTIERALQICKKDLRSNYGKYGIHTSGSVSFKDEYWARDTFFACLGATRIEDFDTVKKHISFFLDFQKENGLIPANIVETSRTLRSFGINFKFRRPDVRYKSPHPLGNDIQDSTLLCIMAFNDYISQSKDYEFLRQNFEKLVKAIEWNIKSSENGLIKEGRMANWQDNIIKSGFFLFTNACYYRALKDIANLSKLMNDNSRHKEYLEMSERTKQRINEVFWNGEFYARWFDKKRFDNFSAICNNLAIIWDIAYPEQAKKIQEKISLHELDKVPLIDSNKKIPWYLINLPIFLLGIYKYHEQAWLWGGCLDIISKKRQE